MASSAIQPTTYPYGYSIAPTSIVYDNGVIATSATGSTLCCESNPITAPPVQTRAVAPTRPTASAAVPNEVTSIPGYAPPVLRSTDRQPSAINNVTPGSEPAAIAPGVNNALNEVPQAKPKAGGAGVDPGAPPTPPTPADGQIPVPGELGSDPKLSYNESFRRTALRPAYSSSRNVLKGRVISRDTRTPEEGIPVVLSSTSGLSGDLNTTTDAEGEFKISLPTGEWSVKVMLASGRVSDVVRSVTAGGGKVYDGDNVAVGELLIKR